MHKPTDGEQLSILFRGPTLTLDETNAVKIIYIKKLSWRVGRLEGKIMTELESSKLVRHNP